MAFLNALSANLVSGFLADFWKLGIGQWFAFISNYGWRVVFFTVCLKLILLPIDFWTRKKSFDNKRLMRRMKPEMDRIEKQYANDQKELMMRKRALQKKYGYGMGMTCLTSILTMIIFISVWTGFREVSKDMNIKAYNDMLAYHESQVQAIYKEPSRVLDEDENGVSITKAYWDDFVSRFVKGSVASSGDKSYKAHADAVRNALKEQTPDITDADLDAAVQAEVDAHLAEWAADAYAANAGAEWNEALTAADYSALFDVAPEAYAATFKTTDAYRAKCDETRKAVREALAEENPEFSDEELEQRVQAEIAANEAAWVKEYYAAQYEAVYGEAPDPDAATLRNVFDGKLVFAAEKPEAQQLLSIAQFAIKDAEIAFYDANIKESFLWVKNIWRPDTWVNPVLSASDYTSLIGPTNCSGTGGVTGFDSAQYDTVMSGVKAKYNGQWNGYLIMVVLVVGLNFLNQWLSMRLQKASGEAQMAGEGANGTMKAMLFIMPLMMAFFAIQYATAFTVYMTTNALMTLASMGLCTLILSLRERRLDRLEAEGVVIRTRAEKRAAARRDASRTNPRGQAPATRSANRGADQRPSYDRRNLKK